MRHVIVSAIAVVLLASTSLAHAAYREHGMVESVDMQAMTLTLASGKVFHLPVGWTDPEVNPEDVVTITYNIHGSQDWATEVVIDQNYSGEDAE